MKGFKAFLLRGNVVDLAVAVVIGAAFGAVVNAFVKDVLMPPIGKLTGGIDFSSLYISLGGTDPVSKRPLGIYYGNFVNALVAFAIIAAVVYFAVVMPMQRLMPKPKVEESPRTRECTECLSSIPVAAKRCAYCQQVQKPEKA